MRQIQAGAGGEGTYQNMAERGVVINAEEILIGNEAEISGQNQEFERVASKVGMLSWRLCLSLVYRCRQPPSWRLPEVRLDRSCSESQALSEPRKRGWRFSEIDRQCKYSYLRYRTTVQSQYVDILATVSTSALAGERVMVYPSLSHAASRKPLGPDRSMKTALPPTFNQGSSNYLMCRNVRALSNTSSN